MSAMTRAVSAWAKSFCKMCSSAHRPWALKTLLAVIFGHSYPSLHLFHQFGFTEWGRLPAVCDLGTQQADVVILGKKLVD